jgi:hypothetical protein
MAGVANGHAAVVPLANRSAPVWVARFSSMSAPIDHSGKTFGCLAVLRKAPSRRLPSGGVAAYWVVRCGCGVEREMKAQSLVSRAHVRCGAKTCTLSPSAMVHVPCTRCGSVRLMQRRSNSGRQCRSCTQTRNNTARGKPAHNRLPGDEGAFNNLFGRYIKSARERGVGFDLDRETFRALTKQDCFYCGVTPSQIIVGRKGSPVPYLYNGVDRPSSELPYQADNAIPCCGPCNWMKGDTPFDEFMRRIKVIAERQRARQIVPPGSGNRVFRAK